jgi:hypothetical protein
VLAEPGASAAAADAQAPAPEAAAEKPRDVPTRDILRALTKLLLEKEIFSRAELLEAVRAVREPEAPASDA